MADEDQDRTHKGFPKWLSIDPDHFRFHGSKMNAVFDAAHSWFGAQTRSRSKPWEKAEKQQKSTFVVIVLQMEERL